MSPRNKKFYNKMLHASTNGVMDWSRFQRQFGEGELRYKTPLGLWFETNPLVY